MREARHSRLYCCVRTKTTSTTTMIAAAVAVFAAVVVLAGRSEGRNDRGGRNALSFLLLVSIQRSGGVAQSPLFLLFPLVLVHWKVLPPSRE